MNEKVIKTIQLHNVERGKETFVIIKIDDNSRCAYIGPTPSM